MGSFILIFRVLRPSESGSRPRHVDILIILIFNPNSPFPVMAIINHVYVQTDRAGYRPTARCADVLIPLQLAADTIIVCFGLVWVLFFVPFFFFPP